MSKLKTIRERSGMSQSELAKASNVNIRMIQQYEQRSRDINGAKLNTLVHLALALQCSVSDIVENDDLIQNLGKVTL